MAKGDNLKGNTKNLFQQGVSGNPNGRPRGSQDSKTVLNRFLSVVMEAENDMTGEIEQLSIVERLHLSMLHKAIVKKDVAAYNAIMDRLEGKAKAEIKINDASALYNLRYANLDELRAKMNTAKAELAQIEADEANE